MPLAKGRSRRGCSNLPFTQSLPGSAKLIGPRRPSTIPAAPTVSQPLNRTESTPTSLEFMNKVRKPSKQVEFLRADHKQPLAARGEKMNFEMKGELKRTKI